LTLARDKPVTRLMLHAAGLPTPEGLAVERPDEPPLQDGGLHSILAGRPLRWPLIVKPACQDGSVGIDQGSVVTTAEALRRRVAVVHEQFGPPVLIEEYIAGRELTVGVIEVPERLALPPAEFEFRPQPGHWPIVTYDTKWREDSPDAHRASYREVADVPAELSRHLSELAVKAFGVLGLRDYGRIDFRVTEAGEPFILEANPNPDLNPIAGLAGVLQAVGLTYDDFLIRLAERALSRK
jgi:D-alanine-D-alanine ligase